MAGMFSGPKAPPKPKPVRMPNAEDETIMEAGAKTRRDAQFRGGRMSTILTDGTAGIGSGGQHLGG